MPYIQAAHPLPSHVVKRDGRRLPFEVGKIELALQRAGIASGEYGVDELTLLSASVLKVLAHRFQGQAPGIEQIRDIVEQALIAANHLGTARAYIAYRDQQRGRQHQDRKTLVDVE